MSGFENGVREKITQLERRVGRLEDFEPAVLRQQILDLEKDLNEVRDELRGVRRAFWGFALSVAGSALVFAFTVVQVWGT